MLRVLVVEDDGFKSDEILALLRSLGTEIPVRVANSVSAAIIAIKDAKYDFIILDMALPSHSAVAGGGSPLSLLSGGLEVLFELQSLARNDPCVIVTQYPELEICGDFYPLREAVRAIEDNYGIRVLGCVEYGQSDPQWKASLTSIYRQLCAY